MPSYRHPFLAITMTKLVLMLALFASMLIMPACRMLSAEYTDSPRSSYQLQNLFDDRYLLILSRIPETKSIRYHFQACHAAEGVPILGTCVPALLSDNAKSAYFTPRQYVSADASPRNKEKIQRLYQQYQNFAKHHRPTTPSPLTLPLLPPLADTPVMALLDLASDTTDSFTTWLEDVPRPQGLFGMIALWTSGLMLLEMQTAQFYASSENPAHLQSPIPPPQLSNNDLLQQPHLPLLIANWDALTDTQSQTLKSVPSVTEVLKQLAVHVSLLSALADQQQPPNLHTYCLPSLSFPITPECTTITPEDLQAHGPIPHTVPRPSHEDEDKDVDKDILNPEDSPHDDRHGFTL